MYDYNLEGCRVFPFCLSVIEQSFYITSIKLFRVYKYTQLLCNLRDNILNGDKHCLLISGQD